MPKCSLHRFLQIRISTCVCYTLGLIAVIQFFACFGKYNYPQLPAEVIETQLLKEITPALTLKKSKLDCDYNNVLNNKDTINNWEIPNKFDDFIATGVANGSYVPEDCNPVFSVAILVTYRNRQSQLDVFLPYMHNFLRKQKIHYKIFLIEQQDEKPWNKGVLYNIGAKFALNEKFPCLILHDVDLLPLDSANLYACTTQPRHMSASIDKFRYVLTYSWLVGGALAIPTAQYVAVNGFSNRFEGWGGEDDDFAARLEAHKYDIVRFPRVLSRYSMLVHAPARKNAARTRLLREGQRERESERAPAASDGFASLARAYSSARLVNHRLFTLIGVQL